MQTPPDSDLEVVLCDATDEDAEDAFGTSEPKGRLHESSKAAVILHGSANNRNKHKEKRQHRAQKSEQQHILSPQDSVKYAVTLTTHRPSSTATRLRAELLDMMVRTHRTEIWFTLVPARIGHNDAVDSAVKAIIKADHLAAGRTNVSEDSCLSSYGRAITSLRDGMAKSTSDDDMLCTVALLVTFERSFSWTSAPLRSHLHGIVAIFMAHAKTPNKKPPSEMQRAIMYSFTAAVGFIAPCIMETPSPLEFPRYLDAEPVLFGKDKISSSAQSIASLRKISFQLFIRLPRLVMLVRKLQTSFEQDDVKTALRLASELQQLHDSDAENEILHHVTVQKAEPRPGEEVMSYVMLFHTVPEFEAANHYWSTRLFLLRLSWRLNALFPTKYQDHGLKMKADLEAEISRIAANVLMAYPWALTRGEIAYSSAVLCLVGIWGCLDDFDVLASRDITPAKARALLRFAGQGIMNIKPGPNALLEAGQRLQAAAEPFAGGRSSGTLAFTFKKAPPGE